MSTGYMRVVKKLVKFHTNYLDLSNSPKILQPVYSLENSWPAKTLGGEKNFRTAVTSSVSLSKHPISFPFS